MKEIKLNGSISAFVDDDDFERVNQYKWYTEKVNRRWGMTYYAITSTIIDNKPKSLRMHNVVMNFISNKMDIDHINGDGLLNTKDNLRIISRSENIRLGKKSKNKSTQYKGVSFEKNKNKFSVCIRMNYKKKRLGQYKTAEEAAKVYNDESRRLFGELAYQNRIE